MVSSIISSVSKYMIRRESLYGILSGAKLAKVASGEVVKITDG